MERSGKIFTTVEAYERHPRRSAFTMVELIAAIAIVAILVAVMIPAVGNFVRTSRETADRQTLAVLNDAINRYKMQGGDVSALTEGKYYGHLLDALRTPVTWNGMTHQFLLSSDPAFDAASTLQASGDGADYKITALGSYTEEAGGSPVNTGQYYILKEDAEGTGTPSGWTTLNNYGLAHDWDYTTNPIEGTQSLYAYSISSTKGGAYFTTENIPENQEWWIFFAFKILTAPTNGAAILSTIRESDGQAQEHITIDADMKVYLVRGDTIGYGEIFTASLNTVYYIWVRKNTDSTIDTWYSTTPQRSSSPDLSAGAYRIGKTNRVNFNIARSAEILFDHMRISDSEIGNDPE